MDNTRLMPRSGSIYGYLNPFEVIPNFVTPVVMAENKRYIVQNGPGERISAFQPLDQETEPFIKEIKHTYHLSVGSPAVYIFVFDEYNVVLGTANEVINELLKKLGKFENLPFTLLNIIEFISKKSNNTNYLEKFRLQTMRRIATSLSQGQNDIGVRWLQFEMISNFLKHVDRSGNINYWDLLNEIENLINKELNVYVQASLVRSTIGMSPKMKRSLSLIGLNIDSTNRRSYHVNSTGSPVLINQHNLSSLKHLANTGKVLITAAQIQTDITINIEINDLNATRKRYIKKDRRKIVKGNHAKDYLCTFDLEYSTQIITEESS
jgi:hypothetical protein